MFHSKPEKCINCACCDIENLKCYPDDMDCNDVYDLSEEDLVTPKRCDFFKQKKKKTGKH